jgi:hypothetical protein
VLDRFPQVRRAVGACASGNRPGATACADGVAVDLHPVRRAARISRSANKRRAIAGCGCMPMGGWKPGWSAGRRRLQWITVATVTEILLAKLRPLAQARAACPVRSSISTASTARRRRKRPAS